MKFNRLCSPVALSVLALLASGAAAQSTSTPAISPECAAKLDKQAWMFAGSAGQVYYGDELSGRWMDQPWADALRLVPRFAEVAAALKARGTTLVLAPVPPRTFLEGVALDRRNATQAAFDPAGARTFYLKFGQALRAAGVPTADLLSGASARDTFQRDIHWTPQGAAAAAGSVAEVIRGLPVYPSLTRQAFVTLPTGPAARFQSDQPVIAKARELCGVTLPPDRYQTQTTVPADGLPAATGNFGEPENGAQRWAFGPASTLAFSLPAAGAVTLHLAFTSPLAGQGVTLSLNGEPLDALSGLAKGSVSDRTYTLAGRAGVNRLDLTFADWNGHTASSSFAPQDARPMAVAVKVLMLSAGGRQADLISPPSDSSALLGRSAPQVTLVGASSSMPLLNFDGALRAALGTDVQNVSYGAAGVFSSLKDYLRDPAYGQAPPRVLVWQFPLIGGDAGFDADFRDVLAAVQGRCDTAPLAAAGSGGSLALKTPVTPAARLHVWADDQTLRTLKVDLGSGAALQLVNSPRMLKQGEFYAALGATTGTPLKLSWQGNLKGQVHAEVCASR